MQRREGLKRRREKEGAVIAGRQEPWLLQLPCANIVLLLLLLCGSGVRLVLRRSGVCGAALALVRACVHQEKGPYVDVRYVDIRFFTCWHV